ncbi:MAG: NUDIX hydrolase [Brevibacterium sp.]
MIDLDTARSELDAVSADNVFAGDFARLFDEAGAAALRREGGESHVTASCLVFDSESESVLLNHHGKAKLWGQFGGHLEPEDDSLESAAVREALEESGLGSLQWVSPTPVDLHVHDLSAAFGRCQRHYDVVYAARARVTDSPVVSDESIDVRWFPLSDLPVDLLPDLPARLPGLYRAAVRAESLSFRG